jgi:hypothetical protein
MVLYPLSSSQKGLLDTWLTQKDKPLCIYGNPGTGKTTLATYLLRDYHSIIISYEHLKHTELIKHISASLFKKNILMMCSENHYKALVIDGFHYFMKQDKQNATKLIEFTSSGHVNHPIIVISDTSTHKLFATLVGLSYPLECRYSSSLYKRILKTTGSKGSVIADQNLHSLKNNLIDISFKDTTESIHEIVHKIIYLDVDIKDIFDMCSGEYTTLSLNLLENSPAVLRDLSVLYDIYQSICTCDMIETKYIDKPLDRAVILLWANVIPSRLLAQNRLATVKPLRYNKYISRSLIQIHNQSLLSSFQYIDLLHLLYQHQLEDKKEDINHMIKSKDYDQKVLVKQMKVYNYYYHKTMTKQYILQTLKTISS